jgi:hypothetical protein
MKVAIILLCLIMGFNAFSTVNRKKAGIPKGFKHYICKQKNLPLEMNYRVTDKFVEIEIHFQKEIKQFMVQNVRGIDGVTVMNFQKLQAKDVISRQKEYMKVEYSKEEGLGYVVVELGGQVKGLNKVQILSISVGELSQEQLNQRNENIIEINSTPPATPFGVTGEKKEKVHRIKLQE